MVAEDCFTMGNQGLLLGPREFSIPDPEIEITRTRDRCVPSKKSELSGKLVKMKVLQKVSLSRPRGLQRTGKLI